MNGKSTKHFEDFDLQLSPPTVRILSEFIRAGLAQRHATWTPPPARAELMNFATELELRTQRRTGEVCGPGHPMHGIGPGWRCPCYPEPNRQEWTHEGGVARPPAEDTSWLD